MPNVPERPLSLGEKLNLQRRKKAPTIYRKANRRVPKKERKPLGGDPQWCKPESVLAYELKQMFRD